jgi:hypothetical protein
MTSFRWLSSASLTALLACTGVAQAEELIIDAPTPISVLGSDQIEAYIGPGLSGFTAGIIVPEITAGVKLRDIGNAKVSLSVEGTFGYQLPAAVNEYWAGGRFGLQVDDVSRIEVVGSAGIGLIGVTPAYRFGIGGQIPVAPVADLAIEAVARGPFGVLPTDFGIRGGLYFYPFRLGGDLSAHDTFQVAVVENPLSFWGGGSLTVVPSASSAIPAADAGLTYSFGRVDVGVRGSLGVQLPANVYHAWAGAEVGLPVTAEIRPYLYGDLGLVGGLPANRVGVGLQHKIDTSLSLVGEFGGQGPLGTINEFTARGGIRFTFGAQ